MSLTGFHPLWDKILSQNLQAVADQGFHSDGSSPYKGNAYRRVYCIREGARVCPSLSDVFYSKKDCQVERTTYKETLKSYLGWTFHITSTLL
jgi:hypothetical protein